MIHILFQKYNDYVKILNNYKMNNNYIYIIYIYYYNNMNLMIKYRNIYNYKLVNSFDTQYSMSMILRRCQNNTVPSLVVGLVGCPSVLT